MKKTILISVLVFILLLVFIISSSSKTNKEYQVKSGLYPWDIETDTLRERLGEIGLPALSKEGTLLHTHQHLDIIIDGKNVPVPEEIGINDAERYISPIHTHDTSGIIHVESPVIQKYYLGQFFDIWGIRFEDNCLGGYCSSNDKKLSVFTNGQRVNKDYRKIELTPRLEIMITFGNSVNPSDIPKSYTFPPDY